jgi:ubiquinone/menaquinone biosynthesis C-methylase UbiE
MNPTAAFTKYRQLGAYHYKATIGARRFRDFDLKLAARYRTAVELLDPRRGHYVLDAGSGEGVAALLCCRRGARVAAVELEAEACALGRELRGRECLDSSRLEFEQLDLYRLPWPDETFDGIVSLEVIEHMADVPQYLAELHRVLKPGGRLVVSTPHRRPDRALQDPYHVREFDGPELNAALAEVFGEAAVLSGWSEGFGRFYHNNRPIRLAGQLVRNAVRFAGYTGVKIFGGAPYTPACPQLYGLARRRTGAGAASP